MTKVAGGNDVGLCGLKVMGSVAQRGRAPDGKPDHLDRPPVVRNGKLGSEGPDVPGFGKAGEFLAEDLLRCHDSSPFSRMPSHSGAS